MLTKLNVYTVSMCVHVCMCVCVWMTSAIMIVEMSYSLSLLNSRIIRGSPIFTDKFESQIDT